MGSLFSSPDPPKPQSVSPPARVEDKAVQDAAAEAARNRKRARGFRSTILGGLADQNPGLKPTFGT